MGEPIGEIASTIGKAIDVGNRIADRQDEQRRELDAAGEKLRAPLPDPAPQSDAKHYEFSFQMQQGGLVVVTLITEASGDSRRVNDNVRAFMMACGGTEIT